MKVISLIHTTLYTLIMKSTVKFSVVIPTRNRDASLRNLLNKILNQTLPPFEIIIVDSSEIKQSSYESMNKSIKYFYTTFKSAAKQRNFGINCLSKDAKVLFFLDDDINPNSTYFEDMLTTLFSLKAVGVS